MTTLADLKQLPQWVGHQDKVPKNPHNGKNASSNNPATWATAAQAWTAKKRHGWDGIGFVFTIQSGIVGVDLDDCFQEDGTLKSWAKDVVFCLDSYTEYSPSGKGLHILVRGTIPHSIKDGNGYEMYNELRYFTVTGNRYLNGVETIEEKQKELDALFVTFGGDFNDPAPLPDVKPSPNQEVTADQVGQILSQLPVHGDYNTYWLPILMAVHDAFPDETGVRLIEAWSPGYKGEVRRKFRSFDRTTKSGVGIATLFHIAKQHNVPIPGKPKKQYKPARRQMAEKAAYLMSV
jgi:hypothetical protein